MRRYTVRVTTNATQNAVTEVDSRELRVRLRAKPIDGQANKMPIELLADYFKIQKSAIVICTGATSKIKIIEVC